MSGTIQFPNAEELAKFLKAFTGSTATFEVYEDPNLEGRYFLNFTGGY